MFKPKIFIFLFFVISISIVASPFIQVSMENYLTNDSKINSKDKNSNNISNGSANSASKSLSTGLSNQNLIGDQVNQSTTLDNNNVGVNSTTKGNSNTIPNQTPDWYTLANRTTFSTNRISSLTSIGTLQVNVQAGASILPNTAIQVYNATNVLVTSGATNSLGNYSYSLTNGTYKVVVLRDNNITFSSVPISGSSTTTITAQFGYLNITTLDQNSNPISASIQVLIHGTSVISISGVQTSATTGKLNLIVAPNAYDVVAVASYGALYNNAVVSSGGTTSVTISFNSVSANFGAINVTALGYMNMPLQASIYIKNYPSLTSVTSGSTSSVSGKALFNLAPGLYQVQVSELNLITFQVVEVQSFMTTNITAQFGALIVYQDQTTNTLVNLYDSTNTTYIAYGYLNTQGNLLWRLSPGNYTVRYSGNSFPVTITAGQKTLVNQQRNVQALYSY